MLAKDILKVIYAPHKVFKDIIQNPKYIGPITIMLLFILAYLGFGYVQIYKSYFDETLPNAQELYDEWTENIAYWNSNANVTANLNDALSGTYYGNISIQFSADTSSQLWAQLNVANSVNCDVPDGYTLLSFRLKQLEPSATPSNVTLYLFSTNTSNFHHNLTSEFNVTGAWNNITLQLGPTSEEWLQSDSPDWGNITGVKFDVTWSTSSNITFLADGFFFHGIYESAMSQSIGNLPVFAVNAFIQFTMQWVALGGFLFLLPKLLKANTTWKPVLSVAGFVQITLIIQTLIFIAVFLLWPDLRFSLQALGGVSGESENALLEVLGSLLTVLWYVERIIYLWAIAICTFAIRALFSFSWVKSIMVSSLAYLLSVIVYHFLAYGTIWL
ncbi:hypothetical protein HXY33_05995 [Candidatus Bathyarchaeota archaeon]|nr:hypothetical protein [Candidatus Bathyarchaeota archaeon]